jgi:uncharacterized membrane protein YhiD involved in acid resistance
MEIWVAGVFGIALLLCALEFRSLVHDWIRKESRAAQETKEKNRPIEPLA